MSTAAVGCGGLVCTAAARKEVLLQTPLAQQKIQAGVRALQLQLQAYLLQRCLLKQRYRAGARHIHYLCNY